MGSGRSSHCGFAYVALLLAIALIGLAASASLSLGSVMARRDAERQLLSVGLEFQQALRSYAGIPVAVAIPALGRGPRTIEELLKDPRVLGIRRHLRQLYADPLTGRNDWELVRDSEGYILGLYSTAEGRPIQRTGFEAPLASFEDAESYSQWVFGLPLAAPKSRASSASR
jgi:type II secretory pathway pseudopilin PulG